jgi:hypothetical protein
MKLDLVNVPLIDRSDVSDLISRGVFEPFTDYAVDMIANGYCTVSLQSDQFDKLCQLTILRLTDVFRKELELWRAKKGPPPRYQDGWKSIAQVKRIATNKLILRILETLYGRKPFPFQTLNFPVGTQQAFHSDALHFHSYPYGYMCGVWIALEDVHPDGGPLLYYPTSHRLPYLSAQMLQLDPKDIESEAHPQRLFQHKWNQLVQHCQLQKKLFIPKRSEALIWHANLLHGGEAVRDRSRSRWSQVTHYYFRHCLYTTPMHSYDMFKGGVRIRNPYDISTGLPVYPANSRVGFGPPRQPVDHDIVGAA